jgi:hypothetical protein
MTTMVLPGRGEGKTLKQVEQEGMGKPSIKWSKRGGENPEKRTRKRGAGNPKKQARKRGGENPNASEEEAKTLKSMQAGRKERDQKSSGDGATKFAITGERAITST